MSSYSPGGSLEDCLTNGIASFEFGGLVWACLTAPTFVENVADCPILKAYSKFLKAGVFTLWRRKPGPLQMVSGKKIPPRSTSITGREQRELYIFYYEAVDAEVKKLIEESGLKLEWDSSFATSNLDYKIRLLFYNAIHRIYENGLFSKGFVRFGRWFCQPLTELISSRKSIIPKYTVAFRFSFFACSSQVITFVIPQRQPTLLAITRKLLLQRQRQKVILSPWGIVGHVLPEQSHFDFDASTPDSEADKSLDEKQALLSSFGGLYSTPEKDKTTTKKELDDFIQKEYDKFFDECGYSDIPTTSEDLPKMLAVEIDGISTYWPTALVAICIDDLKDTDDVEDDDISEIDFTEIPTYSPSNDFSGCRIARRFFEDALFLPPERHDEKLSLLDCTQKELCTCRSCNAFEASFDALPSISPATIVNPNTPHSVQTKISEPPSVPPTSIESIHSTSADLKHLRKHLPRYKQQTFFLPSDYQKEQPKSPKIEAEIEEVRRSDVYPTTSWATVTGPIEYPTNQLQVNSNHFMAPGGDIYKLLPQFRGEQDWDDTIAVDGPISPYVSANSMTPENTSKRKDDENMDLRRKISDLETYRDDASSPYHPTTLEEGHPILRALLNSTETSPSGQGSPTFGEFYDYSEYPEVNGEVRKEVMTPKRRITGDMFSNDAYDQRNIITYKSRDIDIGRIGIPDIFDYFESGDFPSPSGEAEEHDCDKTEEFNDPSQLPLSFMGAQPMETDNFEDSIEKIPDSNSPFPSFLECLRNNFPVPDSETFPSQEPSTSKTADTDVTMLSENDAVEMDTFNEASTSLQPLSIPNGISSDAPKTLDEALKQAIEPIMEIDSQTQDEKQRIVALYQKHNPFPLSEAVVAEQMKTLEALDEELVPQMVEKPTTLNADTFAEVEDIMFERAVPYHALIKNLKNNLPHLGQNLCISGIAVLPHSFEFSGNPFTDYKADDLEPEDPLYKRTQRERIPGCPPYIKKKQSKTKSKKQLNLQAVEAKEYEIKNYFYHNRQAQFHQQRQHQMFLQSRQNSFMNNSPQMNPMFNNSLPHTPSPMTTPRYMQPHSNTLTVCGSNTGGSVQMADVGMNGYPPMMGPPSISSTPNSMMSSSMGYGPSPQMTKPFMPQSQAYNGLLPPESYQPPNQRMATPSADNLLLNPLLPPAHMDSTALQIFEKVRKSFGYIFATLLRDSTFDLHFDVVYDSCPLCSCTESIRTVEYGTYITFPIETQVIDRLSEQHAFNRFSGLIIKKNRGSEDESCFCAFSAIRHRYLCEANSNLFTDDIREATGSAVMVQIEKGELKWFNPLKSGDWQFLDAFRWYLLGHNLAAYIRTGYYIGELPSIDTVNEFERQVAPKKEYIVSGIDQGELDFIVSTALDSALVNRMFGPERASRQASDLTSLIHPWAVQLAEKTAPPNDMEHSGLMSTLVNVIKNIPQNNLMPSNSAGTIEGPLTWKALHHKATKMYKVQGDEKEEDTSHGPEPVPAILVGSEKDLIMTAPSAVWAWDRYSLAPYSWPKNVLYVVVTPEQTYSPDLNKAFGDFFKALTCSYEKQRLGRHLPLPPKGKEVNIASGLLRVPLQSLSYDNDHKSLVEKLEYFINQYLDVFQKLFGEIDCFDKRTFFEAVYRDFHSTHQSAQGPSESTTMPPPPVIPGPSPMPPGDPTYGSPMYTTNQQHTNSPIPAMNATMYENNINPRTPDQQQFNCNSHNFLGPDDPLSQISIDNGIDELMHHDEENPALPHVLVIYIINPFFFGSANTQEYFSKLVTVKLLQSFNKILANLRHLEKPRVQFELVDMRTIFDYAAFANDPLQEYLQPLTEMTVNDAQPPTSALRKLAFTVYTQPRQLHVEAIRDLQPKSMTRFGPFSQRIEILDSLQANPSPTYRIPTAPYILAPKNSNYEITPQGKLKLKNPDEKVLFVTYCLVKDDFLIVSVTDDRGELCDTKVISISRRTEEKPVANAGTASKISHVVDAINRLWAYIQGVMSLDTKNWRLVIGRFGKIGHGESKAWTSILSKKSLQAYNSILKGRDKDLQTPAIDKTSILTQSTSCKTCTLNPGFQETPALIAACLVSTEADAYFKVFSELLADIKAKNRLQPNDYSITHIMVFPTSPSISNEADAGLMEDKDDDFNFFNAAADDNTGFLGDEELNNLDINELGDVSTTTSSIANQPIAMGFLISTAPAVDVPEWFWSQCPNAKYQTPVHLRSALHLSIPHVQQTDDIMVSLTENHPLESNKTEEVLTYILQTYNDLSWLNMDMTTGQRKSCLPIHIQNLLTLYNGMDTALY